MARLPEEKRREITRLLAQGVDKTQIAQDLGVCRNSVIQHAKREGIATGLAAVSAPDWSERGDDATVGLNVDHAITTLDELIRVAGVDTKVWRVDSWECTAWNSVTKDAAKEAHLHQLFRVHAKLKRLAPKPFLDALEQLFTDVERRAPVYPRQQFRSLQGNTLVEIDLMDAHFGKLAWAPESGEDYDLKIAETVWLNAVDDLMESIGHLKIGRFVLPLGNDLMHIDSQANTTTGGTVVDVDGRLAKIIETAERAAIAAIERLMAVAPVDVIWVPGNHDRMTSYYLARTIKAWFRQTDRVQVDCGPAIRKYRLYGANLLGWQHGDHTTDQQLKTLPGLMAIEQPADWAKAKCREWKLGHQHRSRKFVQMSTESQQGVCIRFLQSISATDSWHFDRGFIGSTRAAEVYLYNLDHGFVGHFVSPART